MRNFIGRCVVAGFTVAAMGAAGGCGGFTVILPDLPQECYQEDVFGTDCFEEIRLVEVCEEDFFGYICYDEEVIDVYCEDVLIDSYIVCE